MPKTRSSIALLAAGSCLALAAVGPADAAKKSCKNKKEESGCKLPSDAKYGGTHAGGGGANVSVNKSDWFVSFSATDRGQGPCNPRFNQASIDFKGRPKVGKTYKFSENTNRPERGVETLTRISGKVKINSAKKATFSGSYFRQRSFRGEVIGGGPCQRNLKSTAKREQ